MLKPALTRLNASERVMCYEPTKPVVGPFCVTQVACAVKCMESSLNQRRGISDVVEPCGADHAFGFVTEYVGYRLGLAPDALYVRPAAWQRLSKQPFR
jgi:hypothetical protein